MRLALVGTGAIGGHLLNAIARGDAGPFEVVAIADVPDRREHIAKLASELSCTWHTDPLDVLSATPDIVVEAAAPGVVREYAARWLDAGADVLTMSVGALADPSLLRDLAATAARTGRHVLVPSGAIGGLDAVRAARVGGLDRVELRTTKPPRALKGAPYLVAAGTDLDALTEPTVVFDGHATEAVVGFPANLNVVAALSLAGIGPDRTRVVLVADPTGERNIHEITASGEFGELYVRLDNRPTPGNPKTSYLAPLSALALLRQLGEPIRVGS
jgi:aspartate dehydrogenase